MKVVIAAAGQGTRMLHLTKHKSKHLINVFKKPFLAYLLDNLLKAGYHDLILVVGYRADLMTEFLQKCNYRAKIVNQFEILGGKEKEYGTACPLKCLQNIIGKENFLAVYGDNLYSVKDLKEMGERDKYNWVAGVKVKNPQKYGVLHLEDGFLKEIVEKPKKYLGNLINTGLYKFTPEIFNKISQISLSPRGEYELTDAVNLLAREKKVKIKEIKDYWFDFGSPSDILKFSKFLKTSGNFTQPY
ncbi:MAG: sugar phosphate nucleotidyltransferase [Patescibacteria group bacterium]|nr:sugar phosphate nucleotidyltransferase [Patescibacteria group bacterium]